MPFLYRHCFTQHTKLGQATKAVLRWKFIAINTYIKKEIQTMGNYSAPNRNWAITPWKTHRGNLNATNKRKKAMWKSTYCSFPLLHMTFWKRQNYRHSKMISGYQELRRREGGINGWNTGDLGAVKLFCVILQYFTKCHVIIFCICQTAENCTTQKSRTLV